MTSKSREASRLRPEPGAARLVSIQCLRGIAALMVVLHHVLHQSPGFLAMWRTDAWMSGVDLFFVISGFVMVYVTNQRERSPSRFLAMRAARIVPVYWFYTLAAAGLLLVAPSLFRSNEATLSRVALSMLFVPYDGGPIVKQGWTLNYEVFFYVLFAAAMAVSVKYRTLLTVSALLLITASGQWVLQQHLTVPYRQFFFYTNPIIVEFAFGMLVAMAFLRGWLNTLGAPWAAMMVAVGFPAMFLLPAEWNRVFTYGVPATVILIGALAFEQSTPVRQRFLQSVGDASYSIYLVHIFAIALLRAFWPLPLQGPVSLALFATATMAMVIPLGRVSYLWIERPSLRYLRRYIDGPNPPTTKRG